MSTLSALPMAAAGITQGAMRLTSATSTAPRRYCETTEPAAVNRMHAMVVPNVSDRASEPNYT